MEKTFIKVHSVKDIIISALITIFGCVFVALPTGESINILGFFMIIAGIILFFLMKTGYKDEETGVKYCKTERFFAQSQRMDLISKIESSPASIDLSEEDKGNAVRLDIYHSKTSGKAYMQVFEYIPYKYEPCSKIVEHELSAVNNIR